MFGVLSSPLHAIYRDHWAVDKSFLAGVFLEAPEDDGVALADAFGVVVAGVVEAEGGDLDGADVVHVEGLEGAGGEFAGGLTADVVVDGFDEGVAAEGDAAGVVVELDVLVGEGAEFGEVAGVVGAEVGVMQGEEGGVELLLAVDVG
jgi:hypothetical protein